MFKVSDKVCFRCRVSHVKGIGQGMFQVSDKVCLSYCIRYV